MVFNYKIKLYLTHLMGTMHNHGFFPIYSKRFQAFEFLLANAVVLHFSLF